MPLKKMKYFHGSEINLDWVVLFVLNNIFCAIFDFLFRLSLTCGKCVQLYKDTIMFEKSCNLRLFLLLYDTA